MGYKGWELVAVRMVTGRQRSDRVYADSLTVYYWKKEGEETNDGK